MVSRVRYASGMAGSAATAGAFEYLLTDSCQPPSVAALWRLHVDMDENRRERVERRTLRIIGLSFLALALYVLVDALRTLYLREAPEPTLFGIAIAAASLVVMPILARAKRRVALDLGSRALSADAMQTRLCAYLSAIVLAGLGLNAFFGWWWADPVAAIFMTLLFAYWVLFSSSGRAKSLSDFLLRQRWVPGVVASKLGKVLHSGGRFDELGFRRLASTVGLLIVHELIGITSFYLLAVALHMPLSFVTIGWVRCYIMLITLLPLTMMGIGVRDGSLIVLLSHYAIAPALAVSYSTLLLGRTFVLGVLGGLSELWTVWRERSRPTTGDTPA